jgi:hypothetical protein
MGLLSGALVRAGVLFSGLSVCRTLVLVAMLVGETCSVGAMANPVVQLTLSADVSGGGPKRPELPQRVIIVVDGSGSMHLEEDGVERWTSVQEQLRADLRSLAASGVPVKLTVVKFGSKPSSVERPGDSGWSGTLAGPADLSQVAGDVTYRLGQPSGDTALFLSMQDAIRALDTDLASGRYSGGQLIIYSDGADSSKVTMFSSYDRLRGETIQAVKELRARFPLSNVILRTFGKEARAVAAELPDVVDLTGMALSAPPKLTQLAFDPPAAAMDALRVARRQQVVVRAAGIAPQVIEGVRVTLKIGDRETVAVAQGDRWVADLDLPQSDRGLDVQVMARAAGVAEARAVIRAPALELPANPREWGLPSCGSGWGVVCGMGEPVSLAVQVPADQATVRWSSRDGDWTATGVSVEHPGFSSPGQHELRVEVRTRDGARSETLIVHALDPSLSIEGPASATVGEDADLRINPKSGALASGARPTQVKWFVDGQPAGEGTELKVRFRQRGKAAVMAEVMMGACGSEVPARATLLVSIAPVPSVALGDTDIVRGAGELNRIPARVMVASRVAAVRFAFPGGVESRAVLGEASAGDDSVVSVPLPADLSLSGTQIEVTATPEVRGDDGRVDAAASERASTRRTYAVRDPNPEVRIDQPTEGQEATYEVELPVVVSIAGARADVGAVKSIMLEWSDGRTQSIQPRDQLARAAITPRFGAGEPSLTLRAVALDGAGRPIGAPQELLIALRQPKLALRASVDQLHRDSASPADLSVTLASQDGAAGWEGGITSTEWMVQPRSAAVVASESKTKVALQVQGTYEIEVSAVVRRGVRDETVGPLKIPVVVDRIVPSYRVTQLNSTGQVGTVIGEQMLRVQDRTSGPVASRHFSIRREGGEWRPIKAESFKLEQAMRRGERLEVRGTFTSIDGSVVEGEAVEFLASPDHNWPIVAVVAVCCLGIIAASWWLCHANEFLGATASWSADETGTEARVQNRIHWIRGTAKCSIITKRVRLPLPPMYGETYAWLADLRKRRAFLEMGGNLAAPQLSHPAGVGITSGSRSGRVRRTTLQPTADASRPVFLTISPSPVAAFIGWMSFTIVVTVILAGFAFIFFRGYI